MSTSLEAPPMAVETEVMAKAARPVDGELRIESRLSVDWESEHGR